MKKAETVDRKLSIVVDKLNDIIIAVTPLTKVTLDANDLTPAEFELIAWIRGRLKEIRAERTCRQIEAEMQEKGRACRT